MGSDSIDLTNKAKQSIESDPIDSPSILLRSRAQTVGQELTYTCVPVDSGQRIGIDRDEDGVLDADEV